MSEDKVDKVNRLIKEEWGKKVENTPSAEDLGIDIESLLNSAYEEVGNRQAKSDGRERKCKRKSPGMRKIMAALLTFALIVGALVVFAPDEGYADIFRFMIGRESSGDKLMEDNLIGNEAYGEDKIQSIMVSKEKLDKEAGFHVPMPLYLPEGYEIEYIMLTKGEEYLIEIEIIYNNFTKQQVLAFSIKNLDRKRVTGEMADVQGTEKKIELSGIKCDYLEDSENSRVKIKWQDDKYSYMLDGNMNLKEAEDIIHSLK